MIKTCNGCRALEHGCNRRTYCSLRHEIEVVERLCGVDIKWRPKYGDCQKPKTCADLSACVRAMNTANTANNGGTK